MEFKITPAGDSNEIVVTLTFKVWSWKELADSMEKVDALEVC